jgi:hypothetical protein
MQERLQRLRRFADPASDPYSLLQIGSQLLVLHSQ